MKETQTSDLSEIVSTVSKIQGVTGIILFGSVARGDYDEYSDCDLLVLFEDKSSMWQNWDKLFQTVGNLNLNLHVIPETLEELKTANPVFRNELVKHGKVLFAKLPLEVSLQPTRTKSVFPITYGMSNLNYRDKMKVIYLLYRKSNIGAVAEMGGTKLSEGCILIPSSRAKEMTSILNSLGVETKKLEIYVSEQTLETWLNQKPTVNKESPDYNNHTIN